MNHIKKIGFALVLLFFFTSILSSCKKSGSDSTPDTPYQPPTAQSGKWRKMTSIKGSTFNFPASFVLGSATYILEGNDVFKYDLSSNTLSKQAAFPGAKTNMKGSAFELGGKGYYGLGGFINTTTTGTTSTYSKQVWRFDPSTEKWSQLKDCPVYGNGNFSYSANGKGYISGWETENDAAKVRIYEYNPDNDTWAFKTNFLSAYTVFDAAFAVGKSGYMIQNPTVPTTPYNGAWQYNTETNSFSKKTVPPDVVRLAFSSTTKGYALCRTTNKGNSFYEYDPSTDKWSQLTGIDLAAEDSRCAFILQGKPYVLSGTSQLDVYELWEYTF